MGESIGFRAARKKVSVVTGLGWMPGGRATEVFRSYDRNLLGEDFVARRTEARGHYRRNSIFVRGNLPVHPKAVSAFRDLETSRIEFRQLPSYSPDSSPPEWRRSGVTYQAMANRVPKDVAVPDASQASSPQVAGREIEILLRPLAT